MKAFVIYVKGNHTSEKYAQKALTSFNSYSGWEPELFSGVTIQTLPKWEKKFKLKMKAKSRVACFKRENNMKMFNTKKSCSLNHYRLFHKCIELQEPIAVVEHDSHCMGDWTNIEFDDVLVMNPQSAINKEVFRHLRSKNSEPVKEGLHDINFYGLHYRHDPEINGAQMIPGTAAYAVTPSGAQKMIDVYEQIGWEQSDFIINTAYVRIQTIMPELFTFKLPNLSTSHGV